MTDGKLHQDVGEIKGKVDLIIGLLERGATKMDDHGRRISSLEQSSSWRSRLAVLLGAALGGIGVHLTKVIVAAILLTALLTTAAIAAPVARAPAERVLVDARRAAILKAVRSIGVYPGAEIAILNSVFLIEAVEVATDYTVTVRTRLIRSAD